MNLTAQSHKASVPPNVPNQITSEDLADPLFSLGNVDVLKITPLYGPSGLDIKGKRPAVRVTMFIKGAMYSVVIEDGEVTKATECFMTDNVTPRQADECKRAAAAVYAAVVMNS